MQLQMAVPINPNETIFNKSLKDFIFPLHYYVGLLLSILFWFLVAYIHNYFISFKHSTVKKSWDSLNRLVSSNYGHLSMIFAIVSLIKGDKCGFYNTEPENYMIIFSCGYFLYDMIFSYWCGLLDTTRIIHHGAVLLGQFECFVMKSGSYVTLKWTLHLEFSNSPMQYRNILQNAGKKETKHFLFWEVVYFSSYTICRIFFLKFLYSHYTTCVDPLIMIKIASLMLLFQSFYIMHIMFKTTLSRFDELKERREKRVSLLWFEVNPEVEKLVYVLKIKERSSRRELLRINKKE